MSPEGRTVQVVVARWREDASWVAQLGLDALVYDKSGQPGPLALPNIGRETHTYLTHIVSNYGRLADFTVFLQADPFRHMGEGADVNALRERIARNVRLGVQFTGFAWYKLKCDRLGRPHAMRDPEGKGRWKGWGRDLPVGAVYGALFAGDVPESFLATAPAGLFFVSRERILARPLEFYAFALSMVEADPEDERNTGHAFERLWHIIFNGKTALNKESYA